MVPEKTFSSFKCHFRALTKIVAIKNDIIIAFKSPHVLKYQIILTFEFTRYFSKLRQLYYIESIFILLWNTFFGKMMLSHLNFSSETIYYMDTLFHFSMDFLFKVNISLFFI